MGRQQHRVNMLDNEAMAKVINARLEAFDEAVAKAADPPEVKDALRRELEEELRNSASPLPRPGSEGKDYERLRTGYILRQMQQEALTGFEYPDMKDRNY